MILYIHGFNSSAQSFKARLLKERLAALGRAADYCCSDLPHRPAAAVRRLEVLLHERNAAHTTLIGSSLGGYYATWLAEHCGCRAVLVNPAVRPYEALRSCLGPQQNMYTGESYEFTEAHLDELRALEVDRITPERYLLLAATGDEVLDYRDALARYGGCRQVIVQGSDHGLSDFGRYLGPVLAYAGVRE